ncbi:MAG: acylneuraminate cytidylyltransferase [Chloroflexi bacterium HGW-Chloroflexi-8]|jgi:CMP-N-acetylneuraminic acid synthetase|nr:MAG: acylneuraminate cytidylyltransferase [Chloroflexi bacterium HGW-Chloroflexi-8]
MNQAKKVVALVPMRHHSVRVPGKNYKLIAGKPLFHHILTTLQNCPEISQIVVDTDSENIIEGIQKDYPNVMVFKRPNYLTADTVPMNEILMYDTEIVPADLYIQTHSTNPLLKSETISSAIQTLIQNFPAYDSLFSVTRQQTRYWDNLSRPINHNPAILIRTQDLPPIYEENSCIYVFTRETLKNKRNRIGERPFLFEIERSEAFDIDEELDFLLADLMLKHRSQIGQS